MVRMFLGCIFAAVCLALLAGAIWLDGARSGTGIPFVLVAMVAFLLAVLFLHENHLSLWPGLRLGQTAWA